MDPSGPDDTRWYFAYGSNMDSESLRRRKVRLLQSRRAALPGYQLVFDLGIDLFRQEPRMANLREAPGATVHGVAHRVTEVDLARLDAEEFTYARVPVDLVFYDGDPARGCAYICQDPRFLLPEAPPSERYLHTLRTGAREHQLDPAFCAWLDAQQAHRMPADPGVPAALTTLTDPEVFSLADLAGEGPQGRPTLAALGGFVFDVSAVDNPLVRAFLLGRDATAWLLGRMLDLPTPHTPDQMQRRHTTWLHHALHDLLRVGARPAGVLEGGLAGSLAARAAWEAAPKRGS